MNSKVKGVLSVVILSTLMVATAVASGHSKKIQVKMNSINIRVNGKLVDEDNMLYKGTTYVPMRAVGEILDKDVGWDPKTQTANIDNKELFNDPYPNSMPRIGKTHVYRKEIELTGTFENPVGIPSSAVLSKTTLEEKYHQYNYRVNLPGGGYIEKISVSNTPKESAHASVWVYDGKNSFSIGSLYSGKSTMSYTFMGSRPDFSQDDFDVIRHEAKKFLNAYGHRDY